MDGVIRRDNEPGIVTRQTLTKLGIIERDKALIDSRELRSKAISQLKLIGALELAKQCEMLSSLEDEYRGKVIFDVTIPTKSELGDFRKEFRKLKESIAKEQLAYFEALYK